MIPDIIQQLHDDIHGLLSHDPGFKFVPVFRSRTPMLKDEDGNPIPGQTLMIEEQIENALGGLNLKNGKCGIAAIVMLPDVRPLSLESPGPALEMTAIVRIIEDRLFNESATGTYISSARLALHTMQLLQRRTLNEAWAMRPDGDKMLAEISLPDERRAHEVRFVLSYSPQSLVKVARPVISVAEDNTMTITCATEGALIYWSTDGSWPGAENPNAWLYEGPVNLNTADQGETLRAVAYDPDELKQASDDAAWDLE